MLRGKRLVIFAFTTLIAFSCISLLSNSPKAAATTGINSQISFQGKIVNSSGVNLTDGTYNMEFKIYSGCSNNVGTGCTPVWTEDYLDSGTNTGGVSFTSGVYQVNLGSISSLSGVNFNSYPLYLSLQIGNNSACTITTNFTSNCGGDGVMTPYILLSATPYSFNSALLGGLGASAFAQLAGANVIQPITNVVGLNVKQNSSGAASADIFDVQTASGSNAIQVTSPSNNSANVAINPVGSSGTVSIGTTATGETVTIGASGTTANTATINIGTTNGAAQAISIGGTVGSGNSNASSTVQISAGQTGISESNSGVAVNTYTNSTTALKVVNASSVSVLNVDTTATQNVTVQGGLDTATLGTELVTSNDFTNATNWTTTGWTTNSSSATNNASNTTALVANSALFSPTNITQYQVSYTIGGTSPSGSTLSVTMGGQTVGSYTFPGGTQSAFTDTNIITTSSTAALTFTPSSTFTGSISAVSVKTLTSNQPAFVVNNTSGAPDFTIQASSSNTNLFVGVGTGYNNTSAGTTNVAIGRNALNGNTSGISNNAIGYSVLRFNTTGSYNTGTSSSLYANTTGNGNTANGYYSLNANTVGSFNSAFGYHALQSSVYGANNTAVGTFSLQNVTNGSGNAAIGYQAGVTQTSANADTTGAYNTFLGSYAGPGSTAQISSSTAIGTSSTVTTSNSINLGCVSGTNGCSTTTNVGIDNPSPSYTLDVAGSARLQTTTNTSTALQIQNSVGDNVLRVGTAGTSTNYINFGGFENNSLTGITAIATGSPTVTSTNPYQGTYNLNLVTTSSGDGFKTTNLNGTVAAGTYTVTFWVKTSAATVALNTLTANLFDSSGHTCTGLATVNAVSTGWVQFTCSATTTSNLTYLQITGTTAATYYIDDLSVNSGSGAFNSYYNSTSQLFSQLTSPFTILTTQNTSQAFSVLNSTGYNFLGVDTTGNNTYVGINGSVVQASNVYINNTNSASTITQTYIGNTADASNTVSIQGGTGATAVSIQTGASGTVTIGTTSQAGTVTVGSTALATGTQTINLGFTNTAGGTTNVNIGAGTTTTAGTTTIVGKTAVTITGYGASTWSTSGAALTITGGTTVSVAGTTTNATLIGTANTGLVEIGNTTAGDNLVGPVYTNSSKGVCITGTAATCGATSATPILLDLDQSTLQGAETAANCTTTINAGGIYYSASTAVTNTTTNELRGCINGAWTDLVTADQLGYILLGVVPSSGTANQGDLGGISGVANGPCKVAWASTTSVTVNPCTAYSGGRKVVITAATTVSALSGVSSYYHICLSGTNGTPAATAANASEVGALPAFSATAPVLCLATVLTGAGSTISNIWDTRVFTGDHFMPITTTAAMSPGWITVQTAANQVTTTTSANAANVMGVIAVGSTAGSTTAINGIMVDQGPAYVSATTGTSATFTAGNTAQTTTTAGYATQAATVGAYKDLGLVISPPVNSACSASTNCQFSLYVNVEPH